MFEKFFSEPVQEPAQEGKRGPGAKEKSKDRRQSKGKRQMGGVSAMEADLMAAGAVPEAPPEPSKPAQMEASMSADTMVAEKPPVKESVPEPQEAPEEKAAVEADTGAAQDELQSALNETGESAPEKPRSVTKAPKKTTAKQAIDKEWDKHEAEKKVAKEAETVPTVVQKRAANREAAAAREEAQKEAMKKQPDKSEQFADVLASFQDMRATVEGIKARTNSQFIESIPEYGRLMKSLDKIEPLLTGEWEEDPQVATHLIETEKQRIAGQFKAIEDAVAQKEAELWSGGSVDAKKEEVTQKPKKTGWWSRGTTEEKKEDVPQAKEAAAVNEKEKDEAEAEPEKVSLSDEQAEIVSDMREQLSRVKDKLNTRREEHGLSHAEAKEESEGYQHARSKMQSIQTRLSAIEKGNSAASTEELDAMRSELAQAMWDMKKELPKVQEASEEEAAAEEPDVAETETEEKTAEKPMEAAEVYDKIRGEVQDIAERMNGLVTSYPALKDEPGYAVFGRQLEKAEGQVGDDESIKSHYSIIRATLSSLERQLGEFEQKALGSGVEDPAPEEVTEEAAAARAQNKEMAEEQQQALQAELDGEDAGEAQEGLMAWGEQNAEKVETDERMLNRAQQKVDALLSENPELENTEAYKAVKETIDALTAAKGSNDEAVHATLSEQLLELQRAGVTAKMAQLEKEQADAAAQEKAQEVNKEMAKDEPDGLMAWGEEKAAQEANEPLVLTKEMRIDVPEEEVEAGGEDAEGEDTPEVVSSVELFGNRIPGAGPEHVFAARAFNKGLLLMRGRVEDPEVAKKLDDVLRVVGYVPDSGLRPEDVATLEKLAKEINMPESLVKRKYEKVDQMYAEVEAKIDAKLASLRTKEGGKRTWLGIGRSTMLGTLLKRNS